MITVEKARIKLTQLDLLKFARQDCLIVLETILPKYLKHYSNWDKSQLLSIAIRSNSQSVSKHLIEKHDFKVTCGDINWCYYHSWRGDLKFKHYIEDRYGRRDLNECT